MVSPPSGEGLKPLIGVDVIRGRHVDLVEKKIQGTKEYNK
jgi:hypothetical protein